MAIVGSTAIRVRSKSDFMFEIFPVPWETRALTNCHLELREELHGSDLKYLIFNKVSLEL